MKKGAFILILLITLLQIKCSKYPKRGESINKGEIIDDFKLPQCYGIKTYVGDFCIVKSIDDIDTTDFLNCYPEPIKIDFNNYSIIGKTINFQCKSKIIRELKIDHKNKKYIYTINYKEVGLCKAMGIAYNLVVVPKIPESYSVNFVVNKE